MSTYTLRKHRKGGIAALAVSAIVGGCGAGIATLASYSNEEIEEYQVDATLEGNRLSVVETIDYDFGPQSRHGIQRFVDLGIVDQAAGVGIENISAATATAHDDLLTTMEGTQVMKLRVGDPDETVNGLHRYQLDYDLVGVPEPRATGQFVFIAIGDRWEVPINDVTVRVSTDFEPAGASCSLGTSSSFTECAASADDGVVTATVDRVEPGQGVALQIETGPDRTPAALDPPPLEADKGGTAWGGAVLTVGLATAFAGVVGSLLAGWWVRRAGSDRTGAMHSPAEAAYASTAGDSSAAAISDEEAAEQVTVQFAPPEGLTPPQGAIVERERVDDAAKTAWLAQAMTDGWVELEGDLKSPTLKHTPRADKDPAHLPAPLGAAFNGRSEIPLGKYDSSFAAGWEAIGGQLEAWKRWSGLWDERRATRNRVVAWLLLGVAILTVTVVGIALVAGLGHHPGLAAAVAVPPGLLLGAGLRAVFGIRTLAVRNPAGFGLWLRTEGFRRFLAESEGQHARWAADHGVLREYSAWAVALGELDRWNQAAAAAGIPPTDPGLAATTAFVGLNTAARTTSVQPSSSGGGSGFSGGGFSGGVGGGGGGSW